MVHVELPAVVASTPDGDGRGGSFSILLEDGRSRIVRRETVRTRSTRSTRSTLPLSKS